MPKEKRPSPAKNWSFTQFDYQLPDALFPRFSNHPKVRRFAYQQEVCPETGRDHLQGCVEFHSKTRPLTEFPELDTLKAKFKWLSCKGNWQQNLQYCTKEDTRVAGTTPVTYGCRAPRPIWVLETLRPWQQRLWDLIKERPDPKDTRTIHWWWEPSGNTGKSAFAKWLCKVHGALLVSGKGTDVLHGVAKHIENDGEPPEIVVWDIPRCTEVQYLSYSSVESLKNGHFFSGKYESASVLMNPPHVVVFSNEGPDVSKMSHDRWKIVKIGTN